MAGQPEVVVAVEGISKAYRLGAIGATTLREEVTRWWERLRRGPEAGAEDDRHQSDEPFWALSDISFDVRAGDVMGIVGPNGAGKSTLLKILSQITAPTSGQVKINGRIASLLEIGTGFHPELTGRENIFLNGAILGMTKAEIRRKFDEIVAFSEIESFIETPVKRYSSGMYVRLAFAVAAHLDPEILIVDEVLAVGDGAFQKKCLGKMGDVAREGRTVLFVSHNMPAVQTLCSRGVLLSHGRIEAIGPTEQVVSRYLQMMFPATAAPTQQSWPDPKTAPGNEAIRLRRITLRAEADDRSDHIDITTSFRVEIEFWNAASMAKLHLNLCVYTADGTPVFETVSWDEPRWHGKPFPEGLFRSTCHIPGDLLNEGAYRLRLLFVDDESRHVYDHHDLLTFNVHDADERREMWFGRFMGHVRPRLRWETELVDAYTAAGRNG